MFRKLTVILGSTLIALLLFTSVTTLWAAKAKPVQLGIVSVENAVSGSTDFKYTLNAYVTEPGALMVKAEITGGTGKIKFTDATADGLFGYNQVTGGPVALPAGYVGNIKLRTRLFYNGKRMATRTLVVAIAPVPATPPPPVTTLYEAGFNTLVTLDPSAAPTNGLTEPYTFLWSQVSPMSYNTVELSDPTVANPTFTTLPIENFVHLEDSLGLVGIDSHQVANSTYKFQVIRSSESGSSTGIFTVISASTSPAQFSMPLGVRQYLRAASTDHPSNNWTLVSRPAGSTAVLENPRTRTPSIIPDVEGDYQIRDAVANATITVTGAKFIGVSACAQCHGPSPIANVGLRDLVTPWSQTGHATFFQRAIDGLVSDHYNENCLSCHTVGYNKAPTARNDGFDDIATDLNWRFPNPLQIGNFASMFAPLQAKGNIQCENCHGPGSQHPGAKSESLNVAVCATCHQDGHYHTRVEQWERSGHNEGYDEVSKTRGTNASCAHCHAPMGHIDRTKGISPVRTGSGPLTCSVCHDPHNTKQFPEEAKQLRIYDTVVLDDSVAAPITLTGQGTSASCMFCHNARRSAPPTYASVTTVPHEGTQADVLLGIRASTKVQTVVAGVTNLLAEVTLENSAHQGVAKCIDCHMYPNPGIGQPGHNLMGDHTFSMKNLDTGEDNLPSCNQCHQGTKPVDKLDFVSIGAGDYDGNGTVDGVQTEVDGLLAILKAKMTSSGLTFTASDGVNTGSYSTNPVVRAVQRNAAWNRWLIVRDQSKGVHNTAFTVRLLQWTYTVLSTNAPDTVTGELGNSFIQDYPNAKLR